MQLSNVDRVLLFAEDKTGMPLTLEELHAKYGFEPDGTNFYYGYNEANLTGLEETKSPLNDRHRSFFTAFLASLKASSAREKTLVLGLEPAQKPNPYRFILENLGLAHALAVELTKLQAEARDLGKRLNITIRFASEMNDPAQIQGNNPAGFRESFRSVRQIFQNAGATIPFSFSPAIRADLSEDALADYWPGDEYVDLVGGTWYIGQRSQREIAMIKFRAYILHRLGAGKPFAISELGGCTQNDATNDAMLQDMIHELESLQIRDVRFKYVTLFLASKWGADATLAFLPAASVPQNVA